MSNTFKTIIPAFSFLYNTLLIACHFFALQNRLIILIQNGYAQLSWALFCPALRDFKSFHSPSSINAPPLFFIQDPAQPAVSLSFSLFCENKSWSYEQIPFSSESYLEELYRSAESTLFRAFVFHLFSIPLSSGQLFSIDSYFWFYD